MRKENFIMTNEELQAIRDLIATDTEASEYLGI